MRASVCVCDCFCTAFVWCIAYTENKNAYVLLNKASTWMCVLINGFKQVFVYFTRTHNHRSMFPPARPIDILRWFCQCRVKSSRFVSRWFSFVCWWNLSIHIFPLKSPKRSRIKSYSMQPLAVQHVLRRSGQFIRQATGISQLRTFTTSKMVLIKVRTSI